MQRWGKRFNWHNRALDFDQYQDQELRRELFSRRVRARKRALDLAADIDEKVAEAVEALKVTKVVKAEGQPDQVQLSLSPTELARLIEVSQSIQHRIFGKAEGKVSLLFLIEQGFRLFIYESHKILTKVPIHHLKIHAIFSVPNASHCHVLYWPCLG